MAKQPARVPTIFEQRLFGVNEALLAHPAAETAITRGVLRAKRSALRTATVLSWVSWPLLVAVLVVSFTHLAEQVARVVPNGTSALAISDGVYNAVALANTGLVDTIALYLVAVSTIAHFTGQKAGRLQWFYLAMTLALNAGYVLRHYPAVNELVAGYILAVDVTIAFLLILMVPVSIYGVEHAQRVVEHIRLALLAEVTTYEDILGAKAAEEPEAVKQLREDHAIINDRAVKLEQTLMERDRLLERLREAIGDYWGEMSLENAVEHLMGLAYSHEENTRARIESERKLAELTQRVTEEWRRRVQEQAAPPPPKLVTPVAEPPRERAVLGKTVMSCEVCDVGELDATEKGIAGRAKWKNHFDGRYACRACREGASI